jgi:hypothetical protein
MKKLLMMLMALPMLMMSCNDEMALSEETVEVSFVAEIPTLVDTRAGDGLTVNKLVCAVFENGQEIVGHRKTIDVTSASGITYSPRLVKGRTYKAVFWAMRDANYDVDDMTCITRSATGSADEADYDAFTATSEVTVVNAESKSVSLTRPLAQLNIGITEEDWTTAKDIFGQRPTTCTISYNAKDAFNALAGVADGNDAEVVRTVAASDNDLTVEGVVYKHLGSCYVLMAEDEQTTLNLKLSVLDQNTPAQSIRENVLIPSVPFERNYKTNLVGGLLTGTVTYNVSIQQGFSTNENNEEI